MVTAEQIRQKQAKIAVVGMGYVGLPLAAAFGRLADVLGFDISVRKIEELRRGVDATGELNATDLASTHIEYVTDPGRLREASFSVQSHP